MFRYLTLLLLAAAPAWADGYVPVRDRTEFMRLVEGRQLRIALYGLGLNVLPNGRIEGEAMGWSITGTWKWQDGYFCREMDWSGKAIPFNCQLVEVRGDQLRFTVDRGAGQSAAFRLR